MTVKEHYDKHLANFYSWMAGDFEIKQKDFQEFLKINRVFPTRTKVALDLGAGHGIQSVALAMCGFNVTAIDFNKQLLHELNINSKTLHVEIIEDDIRSVKNYTKLQPELIVCCGDTLTHLENKSEIKRFIEDCTTALIANGKLILSFRDYSKELKDDDRFIPVKSDNEKILTCFLEYQPELVKVTDLLYERKEEGWLQKVSSYNKVRVSSNEIEEILKENGLKVIFNKPVQRLQTIIAEK